MIQHAEVIRRLQREVELNGSKHRAAIALDVSPQYLGDALAGKRAIGPKLLKSLGLRRKIVKTVTYEVVRGRSR